jgi:MFS family permease
MRFNYRQILGLDYADEMPLPPAQDAGLRHLYTNGVFGMFSENAAANYTNLYLLSLNASNAQIGLYNTLTQVATAITPLPGAAIAERTGAYRGIILWPNIVARVGFLLLALLPVVMGPQSAWVVTAAMVLLVGRTVLGQFTAATWTAFVGKLVPPRIRVRYFSARTFAMSIASMLGTLIAGQIIAGFAAPVGYQIVFVMAGLIGFAASFAFARIPRSQFPVKEQRFPKQSLGEIRDSRLTAKSPISNLQSLLSNNPIFVRYTLAGCLFALAVNIGGPFIQVYQAKALGFSAAQISYIVTAELISSLVAGRVYGSWVFARFGDFRVMRVLRVLTAVVPFGWIFIQNPILGALNQMIAGAVWSGHELAAFNGLLSVTPEEGRARYIAINAFAVSICAALGPALGGLLSEVIGYQPLFALSAALRVAAGILFIVLVRDWNRK